MIKSKPYFSMLEDGAVINLESNTYQGFADHFPASPSRPASCSQNGAPPRACGLDWRLRQSVKVRLWLGTPSAFD